MARKAERERHGPVDGQGEGEDVAGGLIVQGCERVPLVAALPRGEGGGETLTGDHPYDQAAVEGGGRGRGSGREGGGGGGGERGRGSGREWEWEWGRGRERGRGRGRGRGYGMVWYALWYREWLAGRSLTLPVFRAGVRGQLAVTLGCCPPGSGGMGGAVAAQSPSTCPYPVLLAPVLPRSRGPCAVRPCATQALRHAHWSGVLVEFCFRSPRLFVGSLQSPMGPPACQNPEALYKGARRDPQFKVTHG